MGVLRTVMLVRGQKIQCPFVKVSGEVKPLSIAELTLNRRAQAPKILLGILLHRSPKRAMGSRRFLPGYLSVDRPPSCAHSAMLCALSPVGGPRRWPPQQAPAYRHLARQGLPMCRRRRPREAPLAAAVAINARLALYHAVALPVYRAGQRTSHSSMTVRAGP